MPDETRCPICATVVVIEEDWPMGRITRCGVHYRKVERFNGSTAADLLDKSEKGKNNAA